MPTHLRTRGEGRGAGHGKKLGKGDSHRGNLLVVVDLLLDLADSQASQGWRMVKESLQNKGRNQTCADLERALFVYWDHNRSGRLLVTSPHDDPHANDTDEANRPPRSPKGTVEVILMLLKETKRDLNDGGMKLDTKRDDHWTDQIRDSLSHLTALNLREDAARKKGQPNSHYSFWINFSGAESTEKSQCLALVQRCWQETYGSSTSGAASRSRSGRPPGASTDLDTTRLAELDQWLKEKRDKVLSRFEAIPDVMDRRIHVPLKASINPAFNGAINTKECEPTPADFRSLVAESDSQMILIWGEGGAGKTSLAYQIARWGLQQGGELADHLVLPHILDPSIGKGEVSERIANRLSHLGGPMLSLHDVTLLLRHKRLLLIVDHYSELTREHRQWVRDSLPASSLVLLTTRQPNVDFSHDWFICKVQPKRLQDEELIDFFARYLKAKGAATASGAGATELSSDDQTRTKELLERLVGNKPITVLLAWMVIDKAMEHIQNGRLDLLPSSVPDLMLDYVRRSGKAIPEENRLAADLRIEPDWIEASLKVLALAAHRQNGHAFHPQSFYSDDALRVLAELPEEQLKLRAPEQHRGLLEYMETQLNLLRREQGGTDANPRYRVALDPLADYLAALARLDELEGKHRPEGKRAPEAHLKEVRRWLDELTGLRVRLESDDLAEEHDHQRLERMGGFLAACRDCYKDWLSRLPGSVEESLRNRWEQVPDAFARAAGIDPKEERRLEVRHLIRRHASDLAWANPELRPKAIAELTAYAKESPGIKELAVALVPLELTMAKTTYPEADRAAAAEALGHIGGPTAADVLIKMVENASEPAVAVRRAAAEALGLIDARADDPEAHWTVLLKLLADETKHLHGETDVARMDATLPLLQGASRGLQRLAARALPLWGTGPGLKVPMLTLTTAEGAVTTKRVDVEVWQLPLPGGLPLEVVKIPGGPTTIGSPRGEEGRDAYGHRPEAADVEVEAHRQVTVPPFAMARFPITQAQWQSLAVSDHQRKQDRPLNPDPAQHKGADLPVESVSWHDCQEWLQRLNRWLAEQWPQLAEGVEPPRLALPSESLWEEACRAGSTTPFHFGDTLDASWANYRATFVYGGGRPGRYRQRPTPVGAYGLVNARGLADMHGNVWEWCADVWHPSPVGAPTDGSAWEEPVKGVLENRLLRGGSWFSGPHDCRTACRDCGLPGSLIDVVGFRVCCLPPGLVS